VFADRREAELTTFKAALERYKNEATVLKKGASKEIYKIHQLMRHPLALRSLASLRPVDFSSYRDERLTTVSQNTTLRELALISSVFNACKKDWSINVGNPIADIRKPKAGKCRTRRLTGDEEVRLLSAAEDSQAPTLKMCITLAIETGMRAGEIVHIRAEQIDLAERVIRLETSKNGEARLVPLTEKAEEVLRSRVQGDRLTSFYDSNGMSAAFRRACARADITGLRFHDLRHEAASRFAPHMPVATLAKVMGWKTLQMAMRYYNPTARELVDAVRFRKAA
jgi:integrase